MTRTDKDFLRVSLIGFGTVGRGLAKVLYGGTGVGRRGIKIVSITDRSGTVYNPDGLDLSRALLVKQSSGRILDYGGKFAHDWDSFTAIERCASDVIVEVTPTNIETAEPALSHIKHAFRHGRHVVCANKGPIALFFNDLTSLATRNSKYLLYGASVCGAIPIIELCRDLLIGNEVYEVSGIFNGSSNYIISRMEESGIGFDDALTEAMSKGITEQNPSQDIDGWDAAAKLVILANSVMNLGLTIHDVAVSGIRGLSQKEIGEALKRGKKIRLIGRISRSIAKVSLEEVDAGSPMAVGSTLNIAVITTDLAKDITVIGRGAGEFETASAVLSDLNTIKNRLYKDSSSLNDSKFGSLKSGLVEAKDLMVRNIVTAASGETLQNIVKKMQEFSISQLPVIENGKNLGMVTEKGIMEFLTGLGKGRVIEDIKATDVMSEAAPVVGDSTPVHVIIRILSKHPTVLVSSDGNIVGILTKVDIIKFLEEG